MDRDEWREVAKRRIGNILRQRRIASKRQLESKIAEAGPPQMRANPHHISDALKELLESGDVIVGASISVGIGKPTQLFAPSDWNPASQQDSDRLERIRNAFTEFLTVTLREDNGESLQIIVQGAIEQSEQFIWLSEPGKSPPSGFTLSGKSITGSGRLDHYLIHKQTGIPIGVEDKNFRDWFYPHRTEIKSMLKKCHTYNMLPVLVTRKVHYMTRMVFHLLGGVAFETHFQCFLPQYADRLADARHKDGLGFADLRFIDEPLDHITNLFADTLPKLIEPTWKTFNNNADLIKGYAVDEDIDYLHLLAELGIKELDEEEGYVEDYEDYEY